MPHRRIRPGAQFPVAARRGGPLQQTGAVLPLPQVITLAANAITATSANLNGSVNPEGSDTSCWFAYGPTVAYGSQTPTLSLGSGSTPLTVAAALSGLTVGQTYHFAAVAQSAAGTVTGLDSTFVAQDSVPVPAITTANDESTVLIPHFDYPFTFTAAAGASVDEQDELADVFACVQAVVACPIGARADVPAFGIPSPLFAQAPVPAVGIERAVQRWEPRAGIAIAEYPDIVSDAIRHVQIDVSTVQTDQ